MSFETEKKHEDSVSGKLETPIGTVTGNMSDNSANMSYKNDTKVELGNMGTLKGEVNAKAGTGGVKIGVEGSYESPTGATVNYDQSFWDHYQKNSPSSMITFGNIVSSLPKGAKVKVSCDDEGNITLQGFDISSSVAAKIELDLTKASWDNKTTGGSASVSAKGEAGYSFIRINNPNGDAFSGRVKGAVEGEIEGNLKRTLEILKHDLKAGEFSNRPIAIKLDGNAEATATVTYYEAPKFKIGSDADLSVDQQINSVSFGWQYMPDFEANYEAKRDANGKIISGSAEAKLGHWIFKGSINKDQVTDPFQYISSVDQVSVLEQIRFDLKSKIMVYKQDLRSQITTINNGSVPKLLSIQEKANNLVNR